MAAYVWIGLDYAWIYVNRTSSEYKLMNDYWETGVFTILSKI